MVMVMVVMVMVMVVMVMVMVVMVMVMIMVMVIVVTVMVRWQGSSFGRWCYGSGFGRWCYGSAFGRRRQGSNRPLTVRLAVEVDVSLLHQSHIHGNVFMQPADAIHPGILFTAIVE